jgi:uncharacterized protein YheU (UPF0270 family)
MSDDFNRTHDSTDDSDDDPRYLVLDAQQLSEDALRGLVEEFASRDGTDYGASEKTLEQKVAIVVKQLESGHVRVVFDRDEERANLVLARELDEELLA